MRLQMATSEKTAKFQPQMHVDDHADDVLLAANRATHEALQINPAAVSGST
jgi:hypothetical protein